MERLLTVGVVHAGSLGQSLHLPRLQDAERNDGLETLRLQLRHAMEGDEGSERLRYCFPFEP
jgi:hypothetical protein